MARTAPTKRKARQRQTFVCGEEFEAEARAAGARLIAGADEVGRGCLFGCVVAGACILDPARPIAGLNDSKQLSEPQRLRLAAEIRGKALAWAVAEVDVARIDQLNIGQASRLAMKLAVEKLRPQPDAVLVDALVLDIPCWQRKIIHGDARSVSIAAASILAKVHRDAILCAWDKVYPQFCLASNKGYPTPRHKAALARFGPTPMHRKSYAPVRECLQAALCFGGEEEEC
ncbi:MAG: ribonuclease HII [Acidobacteriota bacterium]|nr:ribonuclease HII [Acidobacteriota bacterium]